MKLKRAFALALLLLALSCSSAAVPYGPRMLESGLTIQELVVPDGPAVETGQAIKVHYTGTLPTGEVFDSTVERGQPLSFVVGASEVPPGLDQGVLGMRLYGRRKLIAPIELMFPTGIPPELVDVTRVYVVVEVLEIQGPG